jgi:hypothetical protein
MYLLSVPEEYGGYITVCLFVFFAPYPGVLTVYTVSQSYTKKTDDRPTDLRHLEKVECTQGKEANINIPP